MGKTKANKTPKPPPDPEAIFRHALCFDYTRQLLAHANALLLPAFAKREGLKIETTPSASGGPTFTVTTPLALMNRVPTTLPMGVMRAFTTELFLKCLLAINKTEIPVRHELLILFDLLLPRQKKRMEELYDQRCQADESFKHMQAAEPATPFTLNYALTQMNKVFHTWRYAFELPWEASLVGEPWAAAGLLILEERPDWLPIIAAHSTLPTYPIP